MYLSLAGPEINSRTLACTFHLAFSGLSGNFYHVTSIKMLHMAIKTINKHFMSLSIALRRATGSATALTRCKVADEIRRGGPEFGAVRRPSEKSATIMAPNQKGVAMNGEDDGCHEASRCGKLRARIHQICSRPTSASTTLRCPTDQTCARRSLPFSPDASICHVNHVVRFNLILFIDVVRALNRLRCSERALC